MAVAGTAAMPASAAVASPMPVRQIQFPTYRPSLPQQSRLVSLQTTSAASVHVAPHKSACPLPPGVGEVAAQVPQHKPVQAYPQHQQQQLASGAFTTISHTTPSSFAIDVMPTASSAPAGAVASAVNHAHSQLPKQLPQQLPYPVATAPQIAWPQSVVSWPQSTLAAQQPAVAAGRQWQDSWSHATEADMPSAALAPLTEFELVQRGNKAPEYPTGAPAAIVGSSAAAAQQGLQSTASAALDLTTADVASAGLLQGVPQETHGPREVSTAPAASAVQLQGQCVAIAGPLAVSALPTGTVALLTGPSVPNTGPSAPITGPCNAAAVRTSVEVQHEAGARLQGDAMPPHKR